MNNKNKNILTLIDLGPSHYDRIKRNESNLCNYVEFDTYGETYFCCNNKFVPYLLNIEPLKK